MVYGISYKTFITFSSEKCDAIYNRIRYLISQKNGITYVISHNQAKAKIDYYDYLSQEKTLALHNAIIRIKSVHKKHKKHCYYSIF